MRMLPRHFRPIRHLAALLAISLSFLLPHLAAAQDFDLQPLRSRRSAPVAQAGPKVRVTARPLQDVVQPGGAFAVAVILDHADHWHTWPAAAQDVLPSEIAEFAIRTAITPPQPPPQWVHAFGEPQWPSPTPGAVPDIAHPGKTVDVPLYQGKAVAYLPVFVSKTASLGRQTLSLTIDYQACNDQTCEMPETIEVSVSIEITTASHAQPPARDAELAALISGFDARALAQPPSTDAATDAPSEPAPTRAGGSTFFGVSIPDVTGPLGLALLALFSALGGLVLNLTPCVLPVIPIKVLTLTRHAGSPGRSLTLGLWMAAGVVAFWIALGIPAALVASFADPSRLFGIWWLTAGIGFLIGLMGLGIMGLFSINLPQQVYMVNPEADTPAGSFLFGVMTAVLGLPCFGFVAGALLPAAAAFGPSATMTAFASIGGGMAAPYLVLAAKPSLVERLPRTGPASELVKQVMGLLLLAAAAYFFGSGMIALVSDYPYLAKQLHWWAVAALGAMAGLWLTVRTFRITPRPVPRVCFGALGLLMASVGVVYALKVTDDARKEYERFAAAAAQHEGALITSTWVDYSEPLLQRALAAGKVVVMDFTAEWCLNCKALKAGVLNLNPVRSVLEADDVVMIRVDLTSTRAPGWDKLRAYGQTGIPLLVIEGPGLDRPWMSNAYTSDQVLRAIDAARPGA